MGGARLVMAVLAVQLAFAGQAPAAEPAPDPPPDPVIAAAGDIACAHDDPHYNDGAGEPGFCRQRATSDLLVAADLAAVLPLGDIQYDSASAAELNLVYDPTWGRVKSISRPILGNHEGAGKDYFDYFNGLGQADGPAGPRGKGWYSFDVGSWHIVALNSNCARVACTAGSEQEQWLRADLAAHPTSCTLAYWHHPRYSSGHDGSNTVTQPLWQALDEAGAEIVLSGHSHDYERFAPLDTGGNAAEDANGIRQFVVGTGGAFFTGGLNTLIPHSEVAQNNTFGVLFLTLHESSYDWEFVPEAGGVFTDTGTTLCRDAPAPPPPPPDEPPPDEPPPDEPPPDEPPPPDDEPAPPAYKPTPPSAEPTPPGPAPTAVDSTAPVVSRLRLAGATLRYTLSEKAVVTLLIRRCRTPVRRARTSRTCARYSRVATLTQRGHPGTNAKRYRGVRRLRPGSYRIAAVAKDEAGNRSRAATLRFRVRGG